MRPEDLRVYHASERVNDRGLPIDVELCRLAVQYAAAEKIEAEAAVLELSAGALKKVQGKKLRDWVYERMDPILRKHMDVYRTKVIDVQDKGGGAAEKPGGRNRNQNGANSITVKTRSLAAEVRATLLAIAEEEPDAIDPVVVQVIEAAEAGSMMSTAKFGTMLDRVSSDGRLRGAFTFNGAYQTNRWTSTGAQVHNFPRLVAADPEAILKMMRAGKPLPGVLRTLKSMLRPAIAPKGGKVIVRGDWNAIEARGLPWLVNSPAASAYMAAFSDDSRDIYTEQAIAAGLGPQRQPGKVVVLALGYGGAEGALATTGRSYDIQIPEPERVVHRWRNANPWVSDKRTGWWASLGRCAMQAMHNPGKPYRAGRVVLQKVGDTLTMQLPSGRLLHYPMPEIVDGKFGPEIAYLKAAWKPKADAKKWPTARLWHGVFAENADQAMCADLLRETLVRCEDEGIEVIGHVHDEVITEEPAGKAKAAGKKLQRCMLVTPKWAAGFPLKVEVDVSPRFRK
jgi:DNA polymerase